MGKFEDSFKKELNERGFEWEEGKHSEERILNADLIIKSPGIPEKTPFNKLG
jgi:UDP-N-acetylmuramoylalanine--D-glutamate ligase